jgi:hypothetical protein
MRGHSGDVQWACAVLEEDQRVHPAQVDLVDVHEVAGDDALSLRGQEFAPGGPEAARSRIDAGRSADLPERRGADRVPEAGELALDPSAAPARVLPASRSTRAFTALAVGGLPGLARRLL